MTLQKIIKKLLGNRLSQRQYYNKKAKEEGYQRFSYLSIREAQLMRKSLEVGYFIVRGTDDTSAAWNGSIT